MKHDPELEAAVAAGLDETLPGDPPQAHSNDLRVAAFRRIVGDLKQPRFEAPASLIDSAKAIGAPDAPRKIWAQLAAGSLGLAGARAAESDSFQLVFEAEELQARLMYARDSNGWEIAGQSPEGWSVRHEGRSVKSDDRGRFHFRSRDLDGTDLSFLKGDVEICIPPASSAQRDEPGRTD